MNPNRFSDVSKLIRSSYATEGIDSGSVALSGGPLFRFSSWIEQLCCEVDALRACVGMGGTEASLFDHAQGRFRQIKGRCPLQAIEVLLTYDDVRLWERAAATEAAPSRACAGS